MLILRVLHQYLVHAVKLILLQFKYVHLITQRIQMNYVYIKQ